MWHLAEVTQCDNFGKTVMWRLATRGVASDGYGCGWEFYAWRTKSIWGPGCPWQWVISERVHDIVGLHDWRGWMRPLKATLGEGVHSMVIACVSWSKRVKVRMVGLWTRESVGQNKSRDLYEIAYNSCRVWVHGGIRDL